VSFFSGMAMFPPNASLRRFSPRLGGERRGIDFGAAARQDT
jgi:hypothetical protein